MNRFLTVILMLTCLMALFCPAFAVVECKMPEDLPAVKTDVAVHDVLIIGAPEETAASDAPAQDIPADGMGLGGMIDGKYATMGDLYQAWGGYVGYPDYVCGVWSTDGGMASMTVAVTDDAAGEKGKEEILSMLANPETVIFTTQKYSYRELQQVMDEITARMGGDSPIVACGVYEMDNNVHISVNEGHKKARDIAAQLSQRYADRVEVELGDMVFSTNTMREDLGIEKPAANLLPFALLVMAALTGLLLVKKLPARVTNTGKVVTEGKPTRAQVETALSEHTETPPDRVEEQLKNKL